MDSNLNYADKKKRLFESLISAENCIIGTNLEQKPIQSQRQLSRTDDTKIVGKRFQGKESIFKRPLAPITKCLKPRRSPDYQVCISFYSPTILVVIFVTLFL